MKVAKEQIVGMVAAGRLVWRRVEISAAEVAQQLGGVKPSIELKPATERKMPNP